MSQSLDRGLQILAEIAAGRRTLTEIASSLGVHKTTVMRLLTTLQEHHFVIRDDSYRYQLGKGLFSLASYALTTRDIGLVARSAVRNMSLDTDQIAYLAKLESGDAVVIEVSGGDVRPEGSITVGATVPLHASAAGKVLLAGSKDERIEGILSGRTLNVFTARTISRVDDLLNQLAQIRDAGFALEEGEHDEDSISIAAPVRNAYGEVVASLALKSYGQALIGSRRTRLVAKVLSTADHISEELGWAR